MDERDAHDAAPASAVSAEAAYAETVEQPSGRLAGLRALGRRGWTRLGAGGHAIAPLDALIDRTEAVARATGQGLDQASATVIEDLEKDAAALTMRTAPLVPACGVLVARERLVRKHASARWGGTLAGLGLTCLIIGILAGVHISLG